MSHWSAYRCTECFEKLSSPQGAEISCVNGHSFPVLGEDAIPAFAFQAENVNEYSIKNAAKIHDNSLDWLFSTHNIQEEKFRDAVLSNLKLSKGDRILITGVGAGNDLSYISNKIGVEGEIYAQDFSQQMLLSAVERVKNKFGLSNYKIHFSLSDAVNLPYQTGFFDAVYHFGGINIFSDISRGIFEMDRVVKEGGRVVLGDEGIAPWLAKTEIGRMLITNNPLYKHIIPLEFLPETSRNVQVNWTINNCYYIVSYTSSNSNLPIDIDLPHEGTRGGTLRKRYFGALEGIDPILKNKLYQAASDSGVSRVDFLEGLVEDGLKKFNKAKS